MSDETEKINLITEKVKAIIASLDQKNEEISKLTSENKNLKLENSSLSNTNSELTKEIESLKTIDRFPPSGQQSLDEDKINGMIKEIEECMALLKS